VGVCCRYYAGIALSCVLLLMVAFMYFGLCFGACGETAGEDARLCNRGTGACLLLMYVSTYLLRLTWARFFLKLRINLGMVIPRLEDISGLYRRVKFWHFSNSVYPLDNCDLNGTGFLTEIFNQASGCPPTHYISLQFVLTPFLLYTA